MENTERLCMGCMNDNGGEKHCPICGYDEAGPLSASHLPTRSWLSGHYLVGKVLESNGEGITYLGWDNESNSIVHIREYFPAALCTRESGHSVKIAKGSEYPYNEGLMSFLSLSKTLARLKELPALLDVTDIFETNNTAYRVSGTVAGITLREFLLRNGGSLSWDQAKPLFLPLLSALKSLHTAGIIHRGISPETLMVGRDGKMRLNGFCIASVRTARSDMTAQLFPGFAAIEQYGFDEQQGDWTDVYGFTASLYRTLVGTPPPEATDRVTNDNMTVPAKIAETVPTYVLAALANGLQILPEDRSQSIDEVRADLVQNSDTAAVLLKESGKKNKKKGGSKRYILIAALCTIVVLGIIGGVIALVFLKDDDTSSDGVSAPSTDMSAVSEDENGEKLYGIPDFTGLSYAELTGNQSYADMFEFTIETQEFNNKVKRGKVFEQSPAAGTTVTKSETTTIKLKISLGPQEVSIPKIVGMTQDKALIALLEMGFNRDSIELYGIYDDTKAPDIVLEVEPGVGSKINIQGGIKVMYNSYKEGESSSKPSSSGYVNVKPTDSSIAPSSKPASSAAQSSRSSSRAASSSKPSSSSNPSSSAGNSSSGTATGTDD